jgi:hypothetical protein
MDDIPGSDNDFDERAVYDIDPDASALDIHMSQVVRKRAADTEGKESVSLELIYIYIYLGELLIIPQPAAEYGVVTTVICENFMVG